MRLWWWWWKRWRRRRDYGDGSGACLNCWLLNFVLVLVSRRFSRLWSLVVLLVVDRWWWCWRRRFFSSSSLSIICAVGLRLLVWFVVWKTERDKDTAKKRKEKKGIVVRKRRKCVCVRGYPTKSYRERTSEMNCFPITYKNSYSEVSVCLSFFFSCFDYLLFSKGIARERKQSQIIYFLSLSCSSYSFFISCSHHF